MARDSYATLCYMDRVGIRELRQNLSVHLRRVKRGESLEVTEHGRPVAVLGPKPRSGTPRERMVASGRLTPGRQRLSDLGPPLVDEKVDLGGALEAGREERI